MHGFATRSLIINPSAVKNSTCSFANGIKLHPLPIKVGFIVTEKIYIAGAFLLIDFVTPFVI